MANSPVAETIGARIKARRRMLNMNQSELAKALGVGQSSIAQYESGNREINATDLVTVAAVLKVPVSYFFADTSPYGQSAVVTGFPPTSVTSRITSSILYGGNILPTGLSSPIDEEQLLGYYRMLNPQMQQAALAMIATLSDNQNREDG